ncbi:hypothetical protein [Flavobacterium sp. CLA17]|uniref:hypothetical protein n=1 Tax=Flavobacterium sp. CLA17 TaxID=2724135 RepID=UPI0019686334|nr:hypothetical protein [Flavobacterium sp. CLA17]QSB29249.1 hypothetical protein HAV12_011080 [Flavobacterium sp. CLA17]
MWSDRYNYLNIQCDENFCQKLDKSVVAQCLLETEFFKQTNHQSFTNTDKFPWVDIVLVETYNGNYSSSANVNQFVTLVAIVCSKGQNIDQQIYIDTFKQIANKLNWKLYLEEDDYGNENIEL